MSEWIAERLSRESAYEARESAHIAQTQKDTVIVATHSAQFFSDVVKALRSEMNSIAALRLEGGIGEIVTPAIGLQIYNLRVRNMEVSYREQHATFQFNRPVNGPALFRLHDGTSMNIRIVALTDASIGAVWSADDYPLTAERLATSIVKTMVEIVKPERR
jgi:hypothetical protein